MDLQLTARWLAANQELDPRLLPLLRAVARTGSLNQAVASLKLSYRLAWGLLGKTERLLDQPLVGLERGRGARLSPLGEKLVAADDAAGRVLSTRLAVALRSLNRDVTALRRHAPARPLVIHASHDLAIAELRDTLPRSRGVILELLFRGSLECLADLARRQCDIAGFHMPVPAEGEDPYAPYRPWLRTRSLKLVRFVTRRQGLMVVRGNPGASGRWPTWPQDERVSSIASRVPAGASCSIICWPLPEFQLPGSMVTSPRNSRTRPSRRRSPAARRTQASASRLPRGSRDWSSFRSRWSATTSPRARPR